MKSLRALFDSCWGPRQDAEDRARIDKIIAEGRSKAELSRGTLPKLSQILSFQNCFVSAENLVLRHDTGNGYSDTFIPDYTKAAADRAGKLGTYAVGPSCIAIVNDNGEFHLSALKSTGLDGQPVDMADVLHAYGFRAGQWQNPVLGNDIPLEYHSSGNLRTKVNLAAHQAVQKVLGRTPLPEAHLYNLLRAPMAKSNKLAQ